MDSQRVVENQYGKMKQIILKIKNQNWRITMPLFAKNNAKQFIPAPVGLHQAVCCDVIDMGLRENPYGPPRETIKICWQLGERMEDGRRFLASRLFTSSTYEGAGLWKFLTSWLGQCFSRQERVKFDLETLLGKNGQIQITHVKGKEDQIYSRVETIVPLSPGQPELGVEDYVRMVDRKNDAA